MWRGAATDLSRHNVFCTVLHYKTLIISAVYIFGMSHAHSRVIVQPDFEARQGRMFRITALGRECKWFHASSYIACF